MKSHSYKKLFKTDLIEVVENIWHNQKIKPGLNVILQTILIQMILCSIFHFKHIVLTWVIVQNYLNQIFIQSLLSKLFLQY